MTGVSHATGRLRPPHRLGFGQGRAVSLPRRTVLGVMKSYFPDDDNPASPADVDGTIVDSGALLQRCSSGPVIFSVTRELESTSRTVYREQIRPMHSTVRRRRRICGCYEHGGGTASAVCDR